MAIKCMLSVIWSIKYDLNCKGWEGTEMKSLSKCRDYDTLKDIMDAVSCFHA